VTRTRYLNDKIARSAQQELGGLVMVKLLASQMEQLASLTDEIFATIYYRYTLGADGVEETHSIDVKLSSLTLPEDGGPVEYFSNDIIRRNLCVLRVGLAMKLACTVYHTDPADAAAIDVSEQGEDALEE